MATGSSLIIRGLQMIGEKPIGGTLTSAEQTAWLAVMNAMLDSWSIDWSVIYQLTQESKALTTNDGIYTIGSGGDWNTTRPSQIVDPCFVRDSSGYDWPVKIIDAVQYGRIVGKSEGTTYPEYLFYDNGYAAGLGQINLYPLPSASLTLYINSWKPITQFAAIGDTLALPPGYEEAISSNFAIRAAAGLIPVSQELAKIARDSLANVKRLNARAKVGVMGMPAGVGGGQHASILTGP